MKKVNIAFDNFIYLSEQSLMQILELRNSDEIRNKMVEKIIYLSVLGIIEKRHFIMLQTIISKNT